MWLKKWYWGYIFDYISIFWLEYISKWYRLHIYKLIKASQSKFICFANFFLQIVKHFDDRFNVQIWYFFFDSSDQMRSVLCFPILIINHLLSNAKKVFNWSDLRASRWIILFLKLLMRKLTYHNLTSFFYKFCFYIFDHISGSSWIT